MFAVGLMRLEYHWLGEGVSSLVEASGNERRNLEDRRGRDAVLRWGLSCACHVFSACYGYVERRVGSFVVS